MRLRTGGMFSGIPSTTVWAVYSEAIAVVSRRGAPLATGSIDRRPMNNYVAAFEGEGIQSLVCFSCARGFPHDAARRKNNVDWITLLNHVGVCASGEDINANPATFCNLSRATAQQLFGSATYMTKYGSQGASCPICGSVIAQKSYDRGGRWMRLWVLHH